MKKLLLILMMIPVIGFGQLNPIYHKEVIRRTKQVVIVQSLMFITAEYFLNKRLDKQFNIASYSFIGFSFASSVYIFNGKKHKKHRRY